MEIKTESSNKITNISNNSFANSSSHKEIFNLEDYVEKENVEQKSYSFESKNLDKKDTEKINSDEKSDLNFQKDKLKDQYKTLEDVVLEAISASGEGINKENVVFIQNNNQNQEDVTFFNDTKVVSDKKINFETFKNKNSLQNLNDLESYDKNSFVKKSGLDVQPNLSKEFDTHQSSEFDLSKNIKINRTQNSREMDETQNLKMEKNDVMFFNKLVENNLKKTEKPFSSEFEMNMNQLVANNSLNESSLQGSNFEIEATEKTQTVSKNLMNMLENAQKTNKPMRIDFDNNISVVLQVDREGKISAKFIPSDKVAEQYLKENIHSLRKSLESQEIEYNEISYKDQRNNNNSRNGKQKGGKR